MTVDELKSRLESAPIGAEMVAVDVDGVEYEIIAARVEDDAVFLSLGDEREEEVVTEQQEAA